MSIQRELHQHLAALADRTTVGETTFATAAAMAQTLHISVPCVSKTLHNLELHGKVGLVRAANGRSIVGFRLLAPPNPGPQPGWPADGRVAAGSTTPETLTAEDLAELLSREILDAEDAAAFLGIARNSLEYAVQRSRIAYVQYGSKKLFTRADLLDYRRRRGRGRNSRLGPATHWVVKP